MALLNSDFESQYSRRRLAILEAALVQGYFQETNTNALKSAASAIKNAYSGEENREDNKVAIKLYDSWATRLEQLPDIDLRTQRSKDIAARLIRLSGSLRL